MKTVTNLYYKNQVTHAQHGLLSIFSSRANFALIKIKTFANLNFNFSNIKIRLCMRNMDYTVVHLLF